MAILGNRSNVNSQPFWIPFVVCLVLTPVFLFVGLVSGGAGHGDYFWAKILFPYTMLSTVFFETIRPVFFGVAMAQFPLYGLMLGGLNLKAKLLPGLLIVGLFHFSTVVACFLLVGENFS